MIEHRYSVVYNSTTGTWYMDDPDFYTDENDKKFIINSQIYDTSLGKFVDIRKMTIDSETIVEDLKGMDMVFEFLAQATTKTDKTGGK